MALNTDIIILSASGNVYDALFLTTKSASWDTKVPKTRRVQRQPKFNMLGIQDVEILPSWPGNTFNKREVTEAANFKLADCWDEGEPLGGSQEWPVCVAQNLRFPWNDVAGAHRATCTSEIIAASWTQHPKKKHRSRFDSSRPFRFLQWDETAVDEINGGRRGPA